MSDPPASSPAGERDEDRQLREMNEALLVSAARQHELAAMAQKAEESARESEERFRSLVVSIPEMVFRCHVTGERIWGSPQWEAFTGLSIEASIGLGWLDGIHPDDRTAMMAAWDQARTTGHYYVEHRTRRISDGAYRWHQTRAVPLPSSISPQGEWVGSSTDIHDLRQLQEEQTVLVAELQHRTRNLIAVIQSIMQQTMRNTDSLHGFAQKFEDRLSALSRVQGLLSSGDRDAITIRTLIRVELDALGADVVRDRITIDGPQVVLPSRAVQTLALALHELTTNARKHGALSSDRGELRIQWTLLADQERRLRLVWVESDAKLRQPCGSPLSGFGRTLIEQALPRSLGAKTQFKITSEGVRCTIELPL